MLFSIKERSTPAPAKEGSPIVKKQTVALNDTPVPSRPAVSPPPTQKANTDNLPGDYKSLRLREMAEMWKGTILEPHTVRLLSMLIQEDGTVTAERRHDCDNIWSHRLGRYLKGCFAMGIMGHNIAARGTPMVSVAAGKKWKLYDYDYAMADFEKEYPGFSTDWRIQFADYTMRAKEDIGKGVSVDSFIRSWNRGEGSIRLKRVAAHHSFVRKALGI